MELSLNLTRSLCLEPRAPSTDRLRRQTRGSIDSTNEWILTARTIHCDLTNKAWEIHREQNDMHIYYILYIYVCIYCVCIYIYACIYLHIHTWHHMTWHDIIWPEMICIGLILLVYISHAFSWGISVCWRNTDLLLMESLPIVGANSRSNIEIGWNRYGINWRLTSKHADVLFWNKW